MTSIVRRPVRSILPSLLPDVDRVFSDFFLEPFSWFPTLGLRPISRVELAPRVDVYETDTEVVVKAELPGVAKEDVEVVAEDGHLKIRGSAHRDEEVKEESYYRCERSFGEFERVVHLPSEIDEQNVKAKYENGVLEIRAPRKAPEPKGTKIEVS
jgi:HSP20 family protein